MKDELKIKTKEIESLNKHQDDLKEKMLELEDRVAAKEENKQKKLIITNNLKVTW